MPAGSRTQSVLDAVTHAVVNKISLNTVGVAGVDANPGVALNGGMAVRRGTSRIVSRRETAFEKLPSTGVTEMVTTSPMSTPGPKVVGSGAV